MKHLKSYKIFESKESNLDVKIYVEDLLLEVNDENIETDVVESINSYLTSLGYVLSIANVYQRLIVN